MFWYLYNMYLLNISVKILPFYKANEVTGILTRIHLFLSDLLFTV